MQEWVQLPKCEYEAGLIKSVKIQCQRNMRKTESVKYNRRLYTQKTERERKGYWFKCMLNGIVGRWDKQLEMHVNIHT